MSDGPLSVSLDLSNVKTTVPLIADGHLTRLRLEKFSQRTVEGKGDVLDLEFKLTQPAPTQDGGIVQPGDFGSTIFESIQLYSKPDSKRPDWFKEKLATRIDALLGTGDPGNLKGKPERPVVDATLVPRLLGQELVALIRVRTGEFTGNEIAKVFFPGDLKQ